LELRSEDRKDREEVLTVALEYVEAIERAGVTVFSLLLLRLPVLFLRLFLAMLKDQEDVVIMIS
jgi:hypothetical protein